MVPEDENVDPETGGFFSANPPSRQNDIQMAELDDSRSIHAAHNISRDQQGRNDVWLSMK
jgi:hypothetical protein